MKFTDERSRSQYHQVPTFTQIVCGMFEAFCMVHRHEPELVAVVGEEDTVLMGIPEVSEVHAKEICTKVNAQFQRRDKKPTCKFVDIDTGLFELYVTDSTALANMH